MENRKIGVWFAGRTVPSTNSRAERPAAFQAALPSEYIAAFMDENDTVAEPFGGADTARIACEQLDRSC